MSYDDRIRGVAAEVGAAIRASVARDLSAFDALAAEPRPRPTGHLAIIDGKRLVIGEAGRVLAAIDPPPLPCPRCAGGQKCPGCGSTPPRHRFSCGWRSMPGACPKCGSMASVLARATRGTAVASPTAEAP